jgi:hypothetical protein
MTEEQVKLYKLNDIEMQQVSADLWRIENLLSSDDVVVVIENTKRNSRSHLKYSMDFTDSFHNLLVEEKRRLEIKLKELKKKFASI